MSASGRERWHGASALCALLWALGGCSAPEETVASAPAPTPRRADPIPYVAPPGDGPPMSGRAVGVVALGSSLDVVQAAFAVVQAMIDENVEGVMESVAEEIAIGRTGRTVPRQMLRRHFESQFALLDYQQFTVEEVVDRDRVEVVPFEAQQPGTPAENVLLPGDVLVRLHMLVTRRNRRRFFESTYEWWFRREGGRWTIVAWGR